MRVLSCTLFVLFPFFLLAQHVGINTNDPQKTLHVDGELQIDSAAYMHKVYFRDALDSTRMVFDPDSGRLEFWDNDTLWYRMQVASPPSELTNGGDYSVEKEYGTNYQGEPAIITRYLNSDGDVVSQETQVMTDDPDEDDDLIVSEVFENGCLIERTIQHGPSGGSTREIYDCPSGTLCLKEEIEFNNSTLNTNFTSITTLTDVKNDNEVLSTVTSGGLGLNLKLTSGLSAFAPGSQLLGGHLFNSNFNNSSLFIFGQQNHGFFINVKDQLVNPVPNMGLEIDEDNNLAAFCNTKEFEQKIDSSLRKRGLLDNTLKLYTMRVQTPTNWLQQIYNPTLGTMETSSSLSAVKFGCGISGSSWQANYEDGPNSLGCTFTPSNRTLVFSHNASVVSSQFTWESATPTFVRTVADSNTGNSITCTTNPSINTRQLTVSTTPIIYAQQWDVPTLSFVNTVSDSNTGNNLSCAMEPNSNRMTFQAGGDVQFRSSIDNTNQLFVHTAENTNTGTQAAKTFDLVGGSFIKDTGGHMSQSETIDNVNGEVRFEVQSSTLSANILSVFKPDVAPNQSIWQVGSNQNNLDIILDANLQLNGNFGKFSGSFKIDHPLDPYNKYLVHSFVESPDMMNIYNGNITTDEEGMAIIELPDYFDALNIEPRYQLTVIRSFAQAVVWEEVSDNQFSIKTSEPNVKVSWQVTGIRNDDYARENRLVPELEKEEDKQGTLMYTGKME